MKPSSDVSVIANTIWGGAIPFGFRFFGLHVLLELAAEIILIWLILGRRPSLKSLTLWVVTANFASFFIGVLLLSTLFIEKDSLSMTALVWFGAFAISWLTEGFVLSTRLKDNSLSLAMRAAFWGNTVSYLIAWGLFIGHIQGVDFPFTFFP